MSRTCRTPMPRNQRMSGDGSAVASMAHIDDGWVPAETLPVAEWTERNEAVARKSLTLRLPEAGSGYSNDVPLARGEADGSPNHPHRKRKGTGRLMHPVPCVGSSRWSYFVTCPRISPPG